jgi:acetyl-CoA C-acetyltransferase
MAAEREEDLSEHADFLGQLLSSFSEVAAVHPDLAWFPRARTPEQISSVSGTNRLVAEPYTKLMCSFPTVDLAAALVVTSVDVADRIGVPGPGRVYPWGIGTAHEPWPISRRRQIHHSVALAAAVDRLLAAHSVASSEISAFDFYSCFPAAVQLPADAFGIDPCDPRRLTVTGGMPYFGGPGASYGMHGIATMVERCRSESGSIGAVAGLGGMMEKFAVGLLSTRPSSQPYRLVDSKDITGRLEGDALPLSREWEGAGTVFAATVLHDRDRGPVAAPAIIDLPNGSRLGARAAAPDLPAALSGKSVVGRHVRVSAHDGHPTWEPA